jgi:hypothetical protein
MILWSKILHYSQFYTLLYGLGQVHVRTNIPRFYSILYVPHKNVKLEFYCNSVCPCSSVQPPLLPFTFSYNLPLLVVYSHLECINCTGVYYCVWTTFTKVPRQALLVSCRLLALCRGSILCLNKALIVVWTLEGRVFTLASGNCDTLQGVTAHYLAVTIANHTLQKIMYVSVQHAETNTMKIMGSWYEHKCHVSSQCDECPWAVALGWPTIFIPQPSSDPTYFLTVVKRFA